MSALVSKRLITAFAVSYIHAPEMAICEIPSMSRNLMGGIFVVRSNYGNITQQVAAGFYDR